MAGVLRVWQVQRWYGLVGSVKLDYVKSVSMGVVLHFPALREAFVPQGSAHLCNRGPASPEESLRASSEP